MAIWVDDAIIVTTQQSAIDALLTTMDENFKIRVHPVTRFVGIDINRDCEARKIYFSQEYYTNNIGGVFKIMYMLCAPKNVPVDPNVRLIKPVNDQSLFTNVP